MKGENGSYKQYTIGQNGSYSMLSHCNINGNWSRAVF